jgi:hypothetical protein
MVVRTPVKITSDEQYKQDIERELSNFVKRENEFAARERQERAEQLGLAFEDRPRTNSNDTKAA